MTGRKLPVEDGKDDRWEMTDDSVSGFWGDKEETKMII